MDIFRESIFNLPQWLVRYLRPRKGLLCLVGQQSRSVLAL
jgi:hypothetical protein